MKMKTSIIAAISLASAGISQAVVPGVEFFKFQVVLPPETSGSSWAIPTDGFNSHFHQIGGPAVDIQPDFGNIGSITIVLELTAQSTLILSSQDALTLLTADLSTSLEVTNDTFAVTSTTGANPFNSTTGTLDVLADFNAAPAGQTQLSINEQTTVTWTVDPATFEAPLDEFITINADTDFGFSAKGNGVDPVFVGASENSQYSVTGTAYYTLVPEPSSALLGCTGLVALLLRRRR